MSKIIQQMETEARKANPQAHFRPGDTVAVHVRIKEGNKERVQVFKGLIIAARNAGLRSTITVRKVSFGTGVERIFPIYAPTIEKIEFLRRNRVRRAKLYYMRQRFGKKARLAEVRNVKVPQPETFEG